MINVFKYTIFLSVIVLLCTNCASESARTAHRITINENLSYTEQNSYKCSEAINKSKTQDKIFNSRIIATPLLGLLGVIAAPALIAMNASLDVSDRVIASGMSETCGGGTISPLQIAQDVTVNSAIGFVMQGSNVSVYPGGEEVPVSAAAEASR